MKLSAVLLSIMLLSGCGGMTRSDYQRPLLSLPDTWQNGAQGKTGATNDGWWDRFDDARLSRVIHQALQSNNDLAAAALTLKQARISAGLTHTNLTPDVALGAVASHSTSLRSGQPSQASYSTSLSLSYELDLWGKLARIREQSEWEAAASEQDYRTTRLATIDTTAQLYWRIALLNQQMRYQQSSLEVAHATLTQIASWQRLGKVGRLDVLQARQTVISRQNQLRSLQQQRAASRNALALLLNRPPAQHTDEAASLDSSQRVTIAQRTPLSVIANRPDVQAAESRLRAALAGSDAARLSFYPALSLEATLNAGSQLFRQWFSDPLRIVGAGVALPFIQWNTVQLTVEQSAVQVQQAAVTFRATVYTALAEVDNALEKRLTADEQRTRLLQSLSFGQQRLLLTQSRYRLGAVDYQTLLNAQDQLLTVQDSLAQSQYDYLYATLQLWLAQGGSHPQPRTPQNASH